MLTRHPWFAALAALCLACVTTIAFSDGPPDNSIPVFAWRTGMGSECDNITIDLLCDLLWNYVDGIVIAGWVHSNSFLWDPLLWCDSTGAYVILQPSRLWELGAPPGNWYARFDSVSIDSTLAYIHPDSDGEEIIDSLTAILMADTISWRCSKLAHEISGFDCIWYISTWDEGSSYQYNRMTNTAAAYDDYMPNMFTQDTTMSQIDSTGVFAWVKWMFEDEDPTHSFNVNFASLHSFSNWAGKSMSFGTTHTQANSVRAYLNTMYQAYGSPSMPLPVANYPSHIDYDAYPFRFVGSQYQSDSSITVTLGDSLNTWLLDHYEGIMDSTFIPASTDEDGPYPIHFLPQCFGGSGGPNIWEITEEEPSDTVITYESYAYRIPSPAEYRMLCNIALLRQAKGIFPYTLLSYNAYHPTTEVLLGHTAGILDDNLIAFDAPYEEWVYRDRPVADYYYAPPDSIPPWTDVDGEDFDPLFDLPSRPIIPQGDRAVEVYLTWKFEPYARLWNSMRETLGEIAIMAPELSQLWWWDGYEDEAWIGSPDSTWIFPFVQPEIRIFKREGSDFPYLFYVNRQCRQTTNPMEIKIDDRDVPDADLTRYALDHSRRFFIPVDGIRTLYFFEDTLEAGQARLVEFIDVTPAIAADLRITKPDVTAAPYGSGLINNHDFRFMAGTDIIIDATVYNMGMQSASNVDVTLSDISDTPAILDTDQVSFSGLSTSGYVCDDDTAILTWDSEDASPGVHQLHIQVESLFGEPDTDDNTLTLVFQILPMDYAKIELDDAWDMDDDSSPDWNTEDITSLTGWSATFPDFVSGMFEGTISDPSAANELVLNTGSGFSDLIDTSVYQRLSFAAKAERTLDIEVHWIDEDDTEYYVDLGEDLTTTWTVIEPVDLLSLSARWDDKKAKSFWLEFSGTNLYTDVSIGWIKLTE